MNIDIAIAGFILTGAGFALKIIAEIKSELKQCYQREAFQNQKIDNCLHQIELLRHELEGHTDKYSLLANGLKERIEHARKRLFEEVERVGSRISQVEQQLGDIAKIVYQRQG